MLGNALTFLFNVFSRREPLEFAGQFFRNKTAVQKNGIFGGHKRNGPIHSWRLATRLNQRRMKGPFYRN
jgi:hypothetical protein